jgi:hypothetical protein
VSSFAVSALYRLQLPAITKYVVPFAQLHGRVVANERFHREGASVDKRALLGLFRCVCGAYMQTNTVNQLKYEIRELRKAKTRRRRTKHSLIKGHVL